MNDELHKEVLEAIFNLDLEKLKELSIVHAGEIDFNYQPKDGELGTAIREALDGVQTEKTKQIIKFLVEKGVNPWSPGPDFNAIRFLMGFSMHTKDDQIPLIIEYIKKFPLPSSEYLTEFANIVFDSEKALDLIKLILMKLNDQDKRLQDFLIICLEKAFLDNPTVAKFLIEECKKTLKNSDEIIKAASLNAEKLKAEQINAKWKSEVVNAIHNGDLKSLKEALSNVNLFLKGEQYQKYIEELANDVLLYSSDPVHVYEVLKSTVNELHFSSETLMLAVGRETVKEKPELLQLLLKDPNVDPNFVDKTGRTSLSYFSDKKYDLESFKILANDKRVNPTIPNNDGRPAIRFARLNGNDDRVRILTIAEERYRKQADKNNEMLDFLDKLNFAKETAHIMGLDSELSFTRPDNKQEFSYATKGNDIYDSSNLLLNRLIAYQKYLHQRLETKVKVDVETKENKETKETKEDKKLIEEIQKKIKQTAFILKALKDEVEFLKFEEPLKERIEKLSKKYQNDELVKIIGGYSEHAVSISIYKDKLIYANRGASDSIKPGVYVYKIKSRDLITPEFFRNILWYQEERRDTMVPVEKAILNVVEPIPLYVTPAKSQEHGTCSFVNPKSDFEGDIVVDEYEATQDLEHSAAVAEDYYKGLTNFLRDDHVARTLVFLRESKTTEKRAFYINILYEILLAHHAELKETRKNVAQRKNVGTIFKLKHDLRRERIILEALSDTERKKMIEMLESNPSVKNGLLIPAIVYGDNALANLLISNGAKIENKLDNDNFSNLLSNEALNLACRGGMEDVVASLLNDDRIKQRAVEKAYKIVKANIDKGNNFVKIEEMFRKKMESYEKKTKLDAQGFSDDMPLFFKFHENRKSRLEESLSQIKDAEVIIKNQIGYEEDMNKLLAEIDVDVEKNNVKNTKEIFEHVRNVVGKMIIAMQNSGKALDDLKQEKDPLLFDFEKVEKELELISSYENILTQTFNILIKLKRALFINAARVSDKIDITDILQSLKNIKLRQTDVDINVARFNP